MHGRFLCSLLAEQGAISQKEIALGPCLNTEKMKALARDIRPRAAEIERNWSGANVVTLPVVTDPVFVPLDPLKGNRGRIFTRE